MSRDLPDFKTIQPLDAQLLGAAAVLVVAITQAGSEGAKLLRKIEELRPDLAVVTQGSIGLFSMDKPISPDEVIGDDGDETFIRNMRRIAALGTTLLKYAAGVAVTAPVIEPVPTISDVAADGTPIFGDSKVPKLYNLALTHEEIHLMFWALRLAEALRRSDFDGSGFAADVYTEAFAKLTEAGVDRFIDKFDAMHGLARADDGE